MYTSLSVAIIAVSVVFIVLCSVAVALRIQARRIKSLSLQADDYVICAALAVNIALCASEIYGAVAKWSGRPLSKMASSDQVSFLKLVYASFFVAQLALTLVKISIVLFYKRIFPSKGFRYAANVMIGLVVCWFVSFFFADLFSAWPIMGHWNRKFYHPIIDYNSLLVATAAIAMVLDVMILCMPVPAITKLQLTFRRKVMVISIFWLGFFCVISSAVRLYYINVYTTYKGNPNAVFSSQLNQITIWSIVESCMSVITACLPTYGPLLRGGPSPESLIHSIRGIFYSRGKSLWSSSNKSGDSWEKGRSGSQGSEIHMTEMAKDGRRELDAPTGNSVSSRPVEPEDMEAQRDMRYGIRVDRSFATDY